LAAFIFSSCTTPINKRKVCIQPFENISAAHIKEVKTAIEKYYGIEVVVLESIDLPN